MKESSLAPIPGKSSEAVAKHSFRTRVSGVRFRFRRIHLIVAGIVVLLLAAGGVAWAVAASGPSTPGPASGGLEAAAGDVAASATSDAPAPGGDGHPVPTWAPDARPPSRGQNRVPGMPSDLDADRDGDTVVLRWNDNTNNEDGFAVFVTQGRTRFQIIVPAGTTRYEIAARDPQTCFAVLPFTWTAPISGYPVESWECTGPRRR